MKQCFGGIKYKKLSELIIKNPKSKIGAKKAEKMEKGEIPFFTSGKTTYYIKENLIDGENLFINDGGQADIKYYKGQAHYADHVISLKATNINGRYLFHYLMKQREYINKTMFIGTAIKNINKNDFFSMLIPVPPIEVQNEIANTLDNFTLLSTELLEELKERQKQYEYYRDKLLKIDNVPIKQIKEISNNIFSGRNKERLINGLYPVYGSTGKISSTNNAIYEKEQILIARVGANAGYLHIANGKYDVSDNTLIVDLKEDVNLKYVYYQLSKINLHRFARGGGQPLITGGQVKEICIPVPEIHKQKKIVDILDKFEKLCNNNSEGLPAEIIARQKQYEYYRNKLLEF